MLLASTPEHVCMPHAVVSNTHTHTHTHTHTRLGEPTSNSLSTFGVLRYLFSLNWSQGHWLMIFLFRFVLFVKAGSRERGRGAGNPICL